MDKILGSFNDDDYGVAQYVYRYGLLESDPKSSRQFKDWMIERTFELRGLRRTEARGFESGKARGVERGKAERDLEIALNAFRSVPAGKSLTPTAKTLGTFGLAVAVVKSARSQVEAERG